MCLITNFSYWPQNNYSTQLNVIFLLITWINYYAYSTLLFDFPFLLFVLKPDSQHSEQAFHCKHFSVFDGNEWFDVISLCSLTSGKIKSDHRFPKVVIYCQFLLLQISKNKELKKKNKNLFESLANKYKLKHL